MASIDKLDMELDISVTFNMSHPWHAAEVVNAIEAANQTLLHINQDLTDSNILACLNSICEEVAHNLGYDFTRVDDHLFFTQKGML